MKKVTILLINLFLVTLIFAETISSKEKRIEDIKKEILVSESFPKAMNLYYSGVRENYTVFYDLNGSEAYYKYRQNKFDHEAESLINSLIEGSPYLVNGEFIGMMIVPIVKGKPQPFATFKEKAKLSLEEKQGIHNIPVFQLISFQNLIPNDIIF